MYEVVQHRISCCEVVDRVNFLAGHHRVMDSHCATIDEKCTGGGTKSPPCAGFTPCALPEHQVPPAGTSEEGVSTSYAPSQKACREGRNVQHKAQWFVLRTTYGREKKAYDYLVAHGVEAFYPTLRKTKIIGGKRRTVEESRIPNIFFAFGTEEELKSFVYDNINLPYLRFYYSHRHIGSRIVNVPLVVPAYQMESLKIICAAESSDIVTLTGEVQKFMEGDLVRVLEGEFKGVVGRVARYKNHRRVGVSLSGLLTICTAYIPSAYLEKIEDEAQELPLPVQNSIQHT